MEGRPTELTGASSDLVIRAATEADPPALADIEDAAGERFREVGLDVIADDPAPSAVHYLAAIRDGRVWVADLGARPVGYAWAEDLGGSGGGVQPHLEQVSVRPEHEGRGIGTALVDRVAAWAADLGGAALTLITFRDVPFNGPWYERRGFRVVPAAELTPALVAVRQHEGERGLDVAPRVVMARPVART